MIGTVGPTVRRLPPRRVGEGPVTHRLSTGNFLRTGAATLLAEDRCRCMSRWRPVRRGVKAAPQILVLMVQVRILAAERLPHSRGPSRGSDPPGDVDVDGQCVHRHRRSRPVGPFGCGEPERTAAAGPRSRTRPGGVSGGRAGVRGAGFVQRPFGRGCVGAGGRPLPVHVMSFPCSCPTPPQRLCFGDRAPSTALHLLRSVYCAPSTVPSMGRPHSRPASSVIVVPVSALLTGQPSFAA